MKPRSLSLLLFVLSALICLLPGCGPMGGGDADPGLSACGPLEGQTLWEVPTEQRLVEDSGLAISGLEVLGGLAAQMKTTGGRFTLNLELQDANGGLLYNNLTVPNFQIDPNTPLVLRSTEGGRIDFMYENVSTVDLKVTKPTGSGLTGVLVFDSSGSTNGTDSERLRVSGGQLFTDQVLDGTQLAVMDFGVSAGAFESTISSCFEEGRLLNDFTSDKGVIKASIDRVTSAGGTPMYDAIGDALGLAEAVHKKGAVRPFIIVFTDGQASDYSDEKAASLIARATAIESAIHTVALMDEGEELSESDAVDVQNLQRLSADTGGLSLSAAGADELPGHFNRLAGVSNSGISVAAKFNVDFNPALERRIYTLEGNVLADVNGGKASAPFKIMIDLRQEPAVLH